MYQLCKEFHCLPSQLDKEDNKTIQELIVIMNAINAHEKEEQENIQKKKGRDSLKKKYGGRNRRAPGGE